MVVSSTTRGAIQALRVLLKSLGGRMGSYGGLQYHTRDCTDTLVLEGHGWYVVLCMRVFILCRDTGSHGAVQCSQVSRWYYGVLGWSLVPHELRGCTGSHGVLQSSLSGSKGSYGILQSHLRGCKDSTGAVQ